MATHTVYTIGHSTRTFEELLALLHENAVDTLMDVRRFPASRRPPHINKPLHMQALHTHDIAYIHEEDLGGRRPARADSPNDGWRVEGFRGYADYMASPEFEEAFERLLSHANNGSPAIMCAEAMPWQCHRQLIADALVARGVSVKHILGPHQLRDHELTAFAVVGENHRITYPKHAQTSLPFGTEEEK